MPRIPVQIHEWLTLSDALAEFTDPALNKLMAELEAELAVLARKSTVVTGLARAARRLNDTRTVSLDQIKFDEQEKALKDLDRQRRVELKRHLRSGEITASAKAELGDSPTIFISPADWNYLNFSQNGTLSTRGKRRAFYSARYAWHDPATIEKLEEAARTGQQPDMRPGELTRIAVAHVFKGDDKVGKLDEAQRRVLAEFDRQHWRRPSLNTITNALQEAGLYEPKPHRKNR
ncbi:hypothetical protein ACKTEK_10140 [Tepidamorphus sp. 3E244]|uniref:hypothetical protein n=1 Tax=Tepidamorphus sp. 3E244 TaxID=3385498 RepID=UPI0038FC252C